MTAPSRQLDPALMSAWLDQELGNAERAEVDAWLASHPEDVEHVRRWTADRDLLRALLRDDAVPSLDEPVPEALRQLVLGPGRANRGWRDALGWQMGWQMAAAASGLLLTGGVIGAALMWQTQRAPQSAAAPRALEWVQRAAVAHAVYAPEVRHPVEVNTTEGNADEQRKQEEHLARWLTKRLAMPVKLFDLRAQGFELVGGRLLPDVNTPSAQLMYQNTSGQRVTVYLRKPDADTPAAFRFERQGELSLFYWVDGPTGYALVGPLPRERLLAMAEAIYQQGQRAVPAAPAAAPASAPRS